MWGRQDDVTATGLWDGMTESRKACLRRGHSARERAGVPEKSKHRRPTTQLPKSAWKKQPGSCPNTRYFFRLRFYVCEMGQQLLLLTKEQIRQTYTKNVKDSCYQNRETRQEFRAWTLVNFQSVKYLRPIK